MPDVTRSVLNFDVDANEKSGLGMGGVAKRLGRADRNENAKRRRSGRSWTSAERGDSALAFVFVPPPLPPPPPPPRSVRTRVVVRKPPGPNEAVNTANKNQLISPWTKGAIQEIHTTRSTTKSCLPKRSSTHTTSTEEHVEQILWTHLVSEWACSTTTGHSEPW